MSAPANSSRLLAARSSLGRSWGAPQGERGVRRVGVLMGYPENDLEGPAFFAAFREELQKVGWMEDRNIRFDARWASPDDAEAMQRYAKEPVALKPDLILRKAHPLLSHYCNKRAPSPSFSRTLPIRSAKCRMRHT